MKTIDICKSAETAMKEEKAYRPEIVNKLNTKHTGFVPKTGSANQRD